MAEGFLRALGGERFTAESAGTVASELHPLAVRVMREIGIDISAHRSKSIDELSGPFDVCVTVCDANCPIPPGALVQLRWEFPDPALAGGTEEERLAAFRIVRDGIERRVRALADRFGSGTVPAATVTGGSGRRIEGGQTMQDKQGQGSRGGSGPGGQGGQSGQGGQGTQGQAKDQVVKPGQAQSGQGGAGGQGTSSHGPSQDRR